MNELNNKICRCKPLNQELSYTGDCPIHQAKMTVTMDSLKKSNNPEAKAVLALITEQVRLELKELIEKQELVSGEWGGMVVVPIDHLLNRIAQLKDTPLKEGNHE